MPRTTVKATYTLDPGTIHQLERIARVMGTTKSEAIRRAIALLASTEPVAGVDAIRALDEVQQATALSAGDAAAWRAAVRAERAASGPGG